VLRTDLSLLWIQRSAKMSHHPRSPRREAARRRKNAAHGASRGKPGL